MLVSNPRSRDIAGKFVQVERDFESLFARHLAIHIDLALRGFFGSHVNLRSLLFLPLTKEILIVVFRSENVGSFAERKTPIRAIAPLLFSTRRRICAESDRQCRG